jgi:predicted metalloprotease with PDZ domain
MAEERRLEPKPRRITAKLPPLPAAHYTVRMPHPASHNFEVEVELSCVQGDVVLAFPAWTPGSYKIRDFARNVSAFCAHDDRGELEVDLLDKQRRLIRGVKGRCAVRFTLYADEFSVRTPHLDDTHGFFLGTNLFPYIEREVGFPARARHRVTIDPPKGWRVSTGLAGSGNTFETDDYDVLGDSIFEIGTHEVHSFKAFGVKHEVAIVGWGNFDAKKMVADIKKLCETEPRLFGGVPYENYLFVIHCFPDAGGGLEHLNSCVCAADSHKFKKQEDYENFLRLVAHEYFHVWNVKRIRPAVLGPFNYAAEQHTRALWVMEGLTQYYEKLWCARAKLISDESLLNSYAEIIEREDARPGRKVMSLEESSWLAWTKLYQADENFVNSAISYYARGAQAGFVLDAKIRALTHSQKSLDDAMKLAFERHGWPKPGFEERGFERMCEEVAGQSLEPFWRDHIRGTRDFDYKEALNVYGLQFKREKEDKEPWLGITQATKDGAFQVRSVEAGSPASEAGVQVRDEVIALNGHKVTSRDFEDRLKECGMGKTAALSVFRRGRLVEAKVKVAAKPASKLKLVRVEKPTALQKKNFDQWLWK